MRNLPVFVTISLILHALLFGVLFGGLGQKPRPVYEVYEVSMVSAPGSARSSAAAPQAARPEAHPVKGFGAITKESLGREKSPSFKPLDLERQARSGATGSPDLRPPIPEDEGAALDRGAGTGEASKNQVWVAAVIARFREVWRPPQGIPLKRDLRTTMMIRVSRTGEILSSSVVVHSGNMPYDKSVEFALNKIRRLPMPPIGAKPYEEFNITFEPPPGF